MTDTPEKKPKIIIDEDWKSQVEQERAQARDAQETELDEPAEGSETFEGPEGPLPPASFDLLVSTLTSQVLVCLGQIPDPMDQRQIVRLDLAQHHIDMLAMLQTKTAGNLTDEEANMLESVLHQLRMLFVTVRQQVGK